MHLRPEPGKGVRLDWSTSREEGVSHFEVERRSEGATWAGIGQRNAAANSAENAYFSYDASPPAGKVYYRIRQVDHDGTT